MLIGNDILAACSNVTDGHGFLLKFLLIIVTKRGNLAQFYRTPQHPSYTVPNSSTSGACQPINFEQRCQIPPPLVALGCQSAPSMPSEGFDLSTWSTPLFPEKVKMGAGGEVVAPHFYCWKDTTTVRTNYLASENCVTWRVKNFCTSTHFDLLWIHRSVKL